jgi:Uma2 family endonuclease
MENQEISLIDDLKLQNDYKIVAQERGKIVYAHTIYYEFDDIEYENVITEDDTPVDNIFSEKQLRLSIDSLQNAVIDWTDRDFMACTNVAIYNEGEKTPIVPDMFLAMDVKQPSTWFEKKDKCYFVKLMQKVPDLVLEIVSNKIGEEEGTKKAKYASMGVKYYIVQDPYLYLSDEALKLYVLNEDGQYERSTEEYFYMPEVNLGMQLWKGLFEGAEAQWKRWCNKEGTLLLTGKERSDKEFERAESESKRAEEESKRAESESKRAEEESKKAEIERLAKVKAELRAEEFEKQTQVLLKEMEEMKQQLKALGLKIPE